MKFILNFIIYRLRQSQMKIPCIVRFILWAALIVTGCWGTASAEGLPVFVSIVPQKYFVQQIGGDLVDVQVMVKPGASPALYEPRPGQMAAISKAGAYFSIGVPFEGAWLDRIASANPHMMVVPTDGGIQKIPMVAHPQSDWKAEAEVHREDRPDGDVNHHEHGIFDPHIWLAPPLVKTQARHILNALLELDGANRKTYESNYRKFLRELDVLDRELNEIFRDRTGLSFMVFHPSWGYFAQTYQLNQIPIEMEGKEPKPSQLRELIGNARDHRVKVIFVQPQFSRKSAEMIAREIDGRVVVADPLAENWSQNLLGVARRIQSALK